MFSFLQVALFIYVQAWRARSRSGCCLFSRRLRRFADAVRGVSCFPADRADLHRCRSGCFLFSRRLRRFAQMPFGVFLVFPQIAQICTDARSGASCFPHRLRRWRQGVSVSFVTMLHVTCYNKVVPYCAGWALRNYIVYILYIQYIYYIMFTPPQIQTSERRCRHTEGAYCNM